MAYFLQESLKNFLEYVPIANLERWRGKYLKPNVDDSHRRDYDNRLAGGGEGGGKGSGKNTKGFRDSIMTHSVGRRTPQLRKDRFKIPCVNESNFSPRLWGDGCCCCSSGVCVLGAFVCRVTDLCILELLFNINIHRLTIITSKCTRR